MSGEHFITRGIWPNEKIRVGGLPQFQGERREIHIDNLVANVLCEKHNSATSHLDQALVDLVNCIRELNRLRQVRERSRLKRHRPMRFVVDGPKVERCVLKMVMNCGHVLRSTLDGWSPPEDLAEVIFGARPVPEGAGLAMLGQVGDQRREMEAVSFGFGRAENDAEPTAVSFELRSGWYFACSWEKPIADFPGFNVGGQTYLTSEHVLHHVSRCNYTHRSRDLGLSLDFDWSGTWTEGKQPLVTRLRSVYTSPPRGGTKRRRKKTTGR